MSTMEIKHENGMVTFLMRTGKDLVRSQMTIGSANAKIVRAKTLEEKDGQLIVDDTYFFPIVATRKRKKQTEGDEE